MSGVYLSGVYFYGGPFSNFVGYPITVPVPAPSIIPTWMQGRTYHLVEYAFQAAKATTPEQHDGVMHAPGPWEAKARGRKVQLRKDWELVKYPVMVFLLRLKFADPVFREILLGTGDQPIYEDSPTDFTWGFRSANGKDEGKNLLGKALMQVRAEIREAK